MLTDRERLRRRAAMPRLVSLHRALGRLRSSLTVMNTGAHPDDEHNGMLAVLRHQMGMRVIIACSTRGEGGQNTLGPERGGALGVVRSRELEEAARALDADIAWLGHGPDDPVHDFGFSKSGPDTLSRWGEARVLDRLVRAYRQFRPDIVIPTFLDVPGQHGHHRAMTQAAEQALALAADPAYLTEGLAPWTVAKFYLPAWSGGGDTYDDEEPPPPATTHVKADGTDPVTGLSYDRLGEVSRASHASQNMGYWTHPAQTEWALHLRDGAEEDSILDGLAVRLENISPTLANADAAIERAIASFPDDDAILRALAEAKRTITAAQDQIGPHDLARHGHRLERKLREIDATMALAAGIDVSAAVSAANVAPGDQVDLVVEIERGTAKRISVTAITTADFAAPGATEFANGQATIPLRAHPDAAIANPFLPDWQSLGGNGNVFLAVEAEIDGDTLRFAVDIEEPLQLAPAHQVSIAPDALILPLPAGGSHTIAVKTEIGIDRMGITPPPGLAIASAPGRIIVTADAALSPGRHTLPIRTNGQQTYSVTPIAYPHIGRSRFVRPLALDVLALDLRMPESRVGYVGGGADRVGLWLERMGADVTALDAEALAGDLSRYDTIVAGIFAFGTRSDLAAATGKLHQWVKAGGHLVTLYHRPSDGWQPEVTPPLPLTIGSPSLRWRVTNPVAAVTVLDPGHKLLIGPNRIGMADFDGWDKERGLYFASAWDEAYIPLLSMNDDGEAPLKGSLLSAQIGGGRHTHTSLVLHHQLDKLVPGAFRLMANLLQPA